MTNQDLSSEPEWPGLSLALFNNTLSAKMIWSKEFGHDEVKKSIHAGIAASSETSAGNGLHTRAPVATPNPRSVHFAYSIGLEAISSELF